VQDIANIQESPARADAAVAAARRRLARRVRVRKAVSKTMREGTELPDDVGRVRPNPLPDDAADVTLALVTE
jgi:hypothetical protein